MLLLISKQLESKYIDKICYLEYHNSIRIYYLIGIKEVLVMRTLSIKKLAETVTKLREEKGYTKEELGNLTGINRIMIGRIEREDFIPSIAQLEELGKVLEFDIVEMFTDKEKTNSFVALRSETLNEAEEEGVDKLFKMMISLRQQIMLRRKFENESITNS